MIEKVNPKHPDKIADRIAGALVDEAYRLQDDPKVAFEVLIGHGKCHIIAETSINIPTSTVNDIVHRIAGSEIETFYSESEQDKELSKNQDGRIRAGDNGIFKGVPASDEVDYLSSMSSVIYERFLSDGKYIFDAQADRMIICQSNATKEQIEALLKSQGEEYDSVVINPLGYWTGGLDVDTGATNRKLGSDMGEAVTGGGLHGKDLSKADVSVNIYAHLKANTTNEEVNICCAIGDEEIDGKPYSAIVEIARNYVNSMGGFEALAEWGLV